MTHVLHDNGFHNMAFLRGRKMSHHKMADGNPSFLIIAIMAIKRERERKIINL